MSIHPRFKTLVRFADGELAPKKRAKTVSHLASCMRCREQVAFLQSLSEAAEDAPHPPPPADALHKIVARREAGERVIFPVANTAEGKAREESRAGPEHALGRRGSSLGERWAAVVHSGSSLGRRVPALAAAAMIFLALAGFVLWLAPREAPAGSGELRFVAEKPTAGAEIQVEYRSGSFFPGMDTLRLRARLRKPWDDQYNRGAVQETVTRLVRDDGNLFRGAFRLPPNVVYGAFAVEDLAGEAVDDNQRRLWELLVHGSDGRPLFEGLEQRIADHMGRNWEVCRETAYWMTKLYPERVDAWALLAAYQSRSLGDEAYEELRPAHRKRYLAFHERLSQEEVLPAHLVHGMLSYWWGAGGNYDDLDEGLFEYWRERLRSEHPNQPMVLFGQENETHREYRDDPDGRVAAVEPIWQRLLEQKPTADRTGVIGAFINNTLNAADDAEDPQWFLRWMDRYRTYDRATADLVAFRVESVLDRDDLRADGLRMLREERARLESDFDALRPLSVTSDRQRVANEEAAATLLFVAGEGLLAAGDTAAALDSLEAATAKAWAPDVLRKLGEVRLATGDTIGAVEALAAVAADPGSSEAFTDSALALLGTSAAVERWHAARENARDRMARQVLARANPQPLPGPVRLRDREGTAASLRELAEGEPLAVVFFSRSCPWAVRALPEIQRVSDWVGSNGGRLVLVTEHEPDEELDELMAEENVELRALHDFKSEATRAFSNFGSPRHYIVDRDGTLIFQGVGKDEISRIPLEVAALLRAGDRGDRSDADGEPRSDPDKRRRSDPDG